MKIGNTIKWTIDHRAIATIDTTSLLPLGGNNIALGDSDVNATTTRHPSLLFSLFDNLVVTDISTPSLAASLSGGNLNLSWPEDIGAGFVLQSATNLAPPVAWSTIAVPSSVNSGTLSVSLPATNVQSFFRLKFP